MEVLAWMESQNDLELADIERVIDEVERGSASNLVVSPQHPSAIWSRWSPPPSLQGGFVGRENLLAQIYTELAGSNGRQLVLVGLGGVGKTRLAAEYCWQFQASYPGGLVWIEAEDVSSRLLQFRFIARSLDPDRFPEGDSRDEASFVAEFIALLRSGRLGGPALWVINNYQEPSTGTAPDPIAAWCPVLDRFSVLITSRLRVQQPGIRIEDVPPLPRDASVGLLLSGLAGELIDADLARDAAKWVDGLPLALELLNRCLFERAISKEELRDMVEDHSVSEHLDAAMDAIRDQVPGGALRGVSELFLASYERLSPTAQALARLLACYGPAPIDRPLVDATGSLATPAVRMAILARSFVIPAGKDHWGRMHPVLASFLRRFSSAEDRRSAFSALMQVVPPRTLRDAMAWRTAEPFVPHALAFLTSAGGISEAELEFAGGVIEFLYRNAQHLDALRLTEALLQTLSSRPEETPLGRVIIANRALFLAASGNRTAARDAIRVIERYVYDGSAGDDSDLEAVMIARSMIASHDAESARPILEKALERQTASGAPLPEIALTEMLLESSLAMLGQYAQAEPHVRRALNIFASEYGQRNLQTLMAKHNLAHTLFAQEVAGGKRARTCCFGRARGDSFRGTS